MDHGTPQSFRSAPQYDFLSNGSARESEANGNSAGENFSTRVISGGEDGGITALSRQTSRKVPEEQPLNSGLDRYNSRDSRARLTRYGSILGSPPDNESPIAKQNPLVKPPSFELPDPAISPSINARDWQKSVSDRQQQSSNSQNAKTSQTLPTRGTFANSKSPLNNAYEAGKTVAPSSHHIGQTSRHLSLFKPRRMHSYSAHDGGPRLFRRLMSLAVPAHSSSPDGPDVPLEAYREIDSRQAEFFKFLDSELKKIESFYKQKENEASDRLNVLRDQLHIMRDRRMGELIDARAERLKTKKHSKPGEPGDYNSPDDEDKSDESRGLSGSWFKKIDNALEAAKRGRFGTTTKAMESLGTPSGPRPIDGNRDYVRRATEANVPYRAAKRKLKNAMQEYYRGLELLKSYAMLNRTGFRKINKKYDKAVNAWPSYRYLNEKVNKSYFVQSEVIEGHLRAVEDLYARYFEGGNHKVAASKLRVRSIRPEDYTPSVFRNGVFVAAGFILGLQGLLDARGLLHHANKETALNTSYLLQVCCNDNLLSTSTNRMNRFMPDTFSCLF